MGAAPPQLTTFFENPPTKTDAPHGARPPHPLKNEAPLPSEKQTPH